MKKPGAFNKRVKRRVTAREHPFFAVSPPGLTRFCLHEIQSCGMVPGNVNATQGGVEFPARPDLAMAMNLHLGSPSRILMRVGRFRAAGFHQFKAGIGAIEWALFLPEGTCPRFKAGSRKSVLYHSDALAGRARDIVCKALGTDEDAPDDATHDQQTVYIRGERDLFHISIDTSGEPLFKRGIKKTVTPAPLRETIAYAMLSRSGFRPGDTLLDPMCGCGTFSLEAAMMASRIPPGYFRSFAFETWPGFSNPTFAWQKSQAEKQFIPCSRPFIHASDLDETALKAAADNVAHPLIRPTVHLEKKDFFSIIPGRGQIREKGVIMLNPPYDKRLGTARGTRRFYRDIGKKLVSDFKGWRIGILIPGRTAYEHLGLKLDLHPVFHGGLNLHTGHGRII